MRTGLAEGEVDDLGEAALDVVHAPAVLGILGLYLLLRPGLWRCLADRTDYGLGACGQSELLWSEEPRPQPLLVPLVVIVFTEEFQKSGE